MTYTRNGNSNGYAPRRGGWSPQRQAPAQPPQGQAPQEPEQGAMVRLSGLWRSETRNGQPMLSGSLGGARLVVLPNDRRRSDKDPSHHLFLAQAQPRQQGGGGAQPPQQPDAGF